MQAKTCWLQLWCQMICKKVSRQGDWCDGYADCYNYIPTIYLAVRMHSKEKDTYPQKTVYKYHLALVEGIYLT